MQEEGKRAEPGRTGGGGGPGREDEGLIRSLDVVICSYRPPIEPPDVVTTVTGEALFLNE